MTSPTIDLTGRVALVAGATRGAGRGIAVELGAAGAVVYVTGRSTAGSPSPMRRPETIEETARLVTEAGGTGIAVRVDHTDPGQVRALAERIDREHGRLDLLVNDIWGGDPLTEWGVPFWRHDLGNGLRMLRNAIDTHIITSWHAAPLLIRGSGGLIVEVTDGVGDGYRGSLFYDLVKASVIRLARAQAEELRPYGVAAVAVTPGFLRSEAVLDHFGVTADTWRDAIAKDPHFAASETPRYIGRGIAHLAADPDRLSLTGTATTSWDLAKRYGFTDVDGTTPDWGRHLREHL
ncbi:MAG: SDR family oxidoreductase [Actinomycetes bacterium]|jgi:NAD(P)-dependent dehydrogenase (short-subunit alcohol dehydrogenase family)|nr:MAG: short-chain dehydrogenase [Actinomycetota bacterium]